MDIKNMIFTRVLLLLFAALCMIFCTSLVMANDGPVEDASVESTTETTCMRQELAVLPAIPTMDHSESFSNSSIMVSVVDNDVFCPPVFNLIYENYDTPNVGNEKGDVNRFNETVCDDGKEIGENVHGDGDQSNGIRAPKGYGGILLDLGGLAHHASIGFFLLRLSIPKTAKGISLKTHELFLVVFVTRYVNLFTNSSSLFDSFLNSKVALIGATASSIHSIRCKEPFKSTYDESRDAFLHWKFAVAFCAVLVMLTHLIGNGFLIDVSKSLWTFSAYLEFFAILPQLIVLQRYGEIENLTGNYIFSMFTYQLLYIVNLIYRANTEANYKHHWVVYIFCVLQTMLHADFFYYYFISGGDFSLFAAIVGNKG